MTRKQCSRCSNDFALGEMFEIRGQVLCDTCAEAFVKESKDLTQAEISRCIDQTICVNCGQDNGGAAHSLIANLPYCHRCAAFVRHRPFPKWVRNASILLALVLVASLSWNYRFYECFHKTKVGLKASEEGKIAVAYRNLDAAAGLVPEDEELRDLATYYRGINFIENGIADSALECFQAVSGKINDQNLSFFKLEARMDIAFDEGEYDEFLKLSLEMKDILPENPMVIATVSSAYACKYATTSQGEYYQKSIQYLDGARAAAKDAPDFREYEQRILHRLSTKKIITKEEFDRLYPNSGQLTRER